jgi:hypothetical protein
MMDGGADGEKISVGDIERAPIEQPPAEPAHPSENPLTGKDEKLGQHLGRIGAFVGGGPEKAGNIAYIVIVAAFVVLVLSVAAMFLVESEKLAGVLDKMVTGSLSLISAALGYLFGASSKERK